MGDRVGIAVIGGGGYWGKNHNKVIHNLPGVEFLYICDANPATEQALKNTPYRAKFTTSVDAVFSDPAVEAVVISTPLSTHYALVMKALAAGKHVLVEKPMAPTVKECEEMVAAAKKANKVLMTGHTYLYNSVVRKMKEDFLDTGELGPIIGMHFIRDGPSPVRGDADSLWDLAPHDISMLLYFAQSYPSLVRVIGRSTHVASAGQENFVRTWIDTPAYPITIDSSCTGAEKKRLVIVQGRDYTLIFDDMAMENKLVKRKTPHSAVKDGQLMTVVEVPNEEPLAAQTKEFVRAIKEPGYRPLSDGVFGLQVVQILNAAQESMETGEPVKVRGGLYSTFGSEQYLVSPRLEIVAAIAPQRETHVHARSLGPVDFSSDKNKIASLLEKIKPQFTLNKHIHHLNALEITPSGISYELKSSFFHEHAGLNKPPSKENLLIYNKIPHPPSIATQLGILPITAMSVVTTADNKVLIGRRSDKTHTVGSFTLLASGFHEVGDKNELGEPSLFATVRREYREELGLLPTSIMDIAVHGISYADEMNRGFGAAFHVKTSATATEVLRCFLDNKAGILHNVASGKEPSSPLIYTDLYELSFTPEAICTFINDHSEGLDMHTVGALLLVGRNTFSDGEQWYQHMIAQELPKHFGRVLCHDPTQFSTKKTIKEFLCQTHAQRYVVKKK